MKKRRKFDLSYFQRKHRSSIRDLHWMKKREYETKER